MIVRGFVSGGAVSGPLARTHWPGFCRLPIYRNLPLSANPTPPFATCTALIPDIRRPLRVSRFEKNDSPAALRSHVAALGRLRHMKAARKSTSSGPSKSAVCHLTNGRLFVTYAFWYEHCRSGTRANAAASLHNFWRCCRRPSGPFGKAMRGCPWPSQHVPSLLGLSLFRASVADRDGVGRLPLHRPARNH